MKMLNEKEKTLLKIIAIYFCEGGRDGDFYPEWVEYWSEQEIKQFALDFQTFNGDDEICPMLSLPISSILMFLLAKL